MWCIARPSSRLGTVVASCGLRGFVGKPRHKAFPPDATAPRLSLSAVLVRAALLAGVLLIVGVGARAAAAESVAVPAYFYPGGTPDYWTQLDQAGPGALAVVNPSSGPGSAPDVNYVGAVKSAEAAGIIVVGYVYTNYGSRSLRAVESDVDKYYNWYSVDGIFFDEASTSCANESYYAQLNNYVKAKGGPARTILNPGTQTNQCYASAADILLTFEGSDSDYVNSYSAPSWVSSYPASRFWHVIYGTSTTSAMATAVQLSQARNAGYVYVTPATLPNPYDLLPTYWSSELSDIGGTTAALSAPTSTAPPVISGTVSQGQMLNASSGSWNGNPTPTYTYQWQDCNSAGGSCTNIAGATGSSYTLVAADVGHTIVVVVSATNSQGQASRSSAATAVVAAGSPAPTGFLGGDYSVEGGGVSLAGAGQALATQATISSTGTLSDMFVYQAAGISGSPTIEAAVYANNNGYPGAQIGDSATNALASAGWLDMGGLQAGSAGSMAVTSGQKVWLIIHVQGTGTLKLAEKGGCSGQGWEITNSPTWLDDPWTSGATATSDCSVSAYVTG
ncbi:MAG TPA: spherulation-specific family 4 protein [Solirubrobacteraceae bacterium]|nr:spherulation-specific family 4 protein [Solirubrobacteraceae bacterium]